MSGRAEEAISEQLPNHHHTLRFKTVLMILLVVVFSPIGNTLLAKGMRDAGPLPFGTPADAMHSIMAIFTSPYIWLGIAAAVARLT